MYKNNIFKRDTSVREDTNQGRGEAKDIIEEKNKEEKNNRYGR
jgi:hypothetical protein